MTKTRNIHENTNPVIAKPFLEDFFTMEKIPRKIEQNHINIPKQGTIVKGNTAIPQIIEATPHTLKIFCLRFIAFCSLNNFFASFISSIDE